MDDMDAALAAWGAVTPTAARTIGRAAAALVDDYRSLHATHADDYFVADPFAANGAMRGLKGSTAGLSLEECIALPRLPAGAPENGALSALVEFVEATEAATLPRAPPRLTTADKRVSRPGKGFTPKKWHETLQLTELVRRAAGGRCQHGHQHTPEEDTGDITVVNIGEGKGHLSDMISRLDAVCRIAGVDCVPSLTEASRARASNSDAACAQVAATYRLSEASTAGDIAAEVNAAAVRAGRPSSSSEAGATSACAACEPFVDAALTGCGVVGLHACGDLSTIVTRVFAASAAGFLALAPCCYHALTPAGFPASDVLHACPLESTVSRTLACAPVERWRGGDPATHVPFLRLHFYRAVGTAAVHPQRLRAPPALFRGLAQRGGELTLCGFMDAVLDHLGFSEGDAAAARARAAPLDTPAHFRAYVAFASLRRCLAGPLEAMYLTDRLLYLDAALTRGGGTDARTALLPLFDPCVSPRSHVLFAVRSGGWAEGRGVVVDGGRRHRRDADGDAPDDEEPEKKRRKAV